MTTLVKVVGFRVSVVKLSIVIHSVLNLGIESDPILIPMLVVLDYVVVTTVNMLYQDLLDPCDRQNNALIPLGITQSPRTCHSSNP